MSIFSRFDYEALDPRAAFYLMKDLEAVITDKAFCSQKFAVGNNVYCVEKTDNYEYIDPVDGTVARNQVREITYHLASVCVILCILGHFHRRFPFS